MTDTIARPTLALGQRVKVNPPEWQTTAEPYEGTVVGMYDTEREYGSAFVVSDPPRRQDTSTIREARRTNSGMIADGSVTVAPVGSDADEERTGAWVAVRQIEPLPETRVPLSWQDVRSMAVGDRLLVASPRPDSDPYPATILSTGEYTTRVQYDVGRPGREGVHGDRDWNLSEYPDWAAFRLDSEPTTQAPLSESPDVQAMRDRITALEAQVTDRDSQIDEARTVLRTIGSSLLDTADRSEWCDEYDRKLSRLYDALPGRFGFDDVFNDAAKRDEEHDWVVNITGHVHANGFPSEDAAIQYVNENAERLVRDAWINGCFEIVDAESDD